MIEVMAAQIELSPIAYVFVGTIMALAGVVLIVFTSEVPIVNILTTILGWFLIILGGMVMIYGVAPELITTGGVVIGFIIWIIATIIVIWNELTAIPRREAGVK